MRRRDDTVQICSRDEKGMENVSIHDLISRDLVYPRTPSRSTERLITIPLPIFDCLRMPDPGDVY